MAISSSASKKLLNLRIQNLIRSIRPSTLALTHVIPSMPKPVRLPLDQSGIGRKRYDSLMNMADLMNLQMLVEFAAKKPYVEPKDDDKLTDKEVDSSDGEIVDDDDDDDDCDTDADDFSGSDVE